MTFALVAALVRAVATVRLARICGICGICVTFALFAALHRVVTEAVEALGVAALGFLEDDVEHADEVLAGRPRHEPRNGRCRR